MEGRVKKVVPDRGFGFIAVDGQKDVFFHRSSVIEGNFDVIGEGQAVSFEIESSDRGPRATNVRVVD